MKVNFENIYEHIGYLLFSVTSGKGKLSDVELLKLTDVVEKTWRPVVNGDSALQMHLVDCIHAGIRYAIENSMTPEQALASFRSFFQIHSFAFGKSLKEKIVSSVMALHKELPHSRQHEFVETELGDLMGLKSMPVEPGLTL